MLLARTRAVDLEGRRLLLEDGDVLPYRHLVVATGSLPSDLGVPGVGLLALGFAQAPALVPWGGALALAALFHGVDESALGLFLWAANLGLWGLAFGEGLGYLLLLLAYGLALYDAYRILKNRMKRALDIGVRHYLAGLFFLGLALLALPFHPVAAALWFALGFVGLVVTGMLYKILPFLVWTHRYAKRALRKAERLWTQGVTFSPEGKAELARIVGRTLARLERALTALATGNRALAERVLAEYPEVLAEVEASREAHLRRLRDRVETRASTLTHLDLLLLLEELNLGVNRLARLVEEIHKEG